MNNQGKGKNPVVDKSFQLALEIIAFSSELRKSREYDLASQIFRSGTSIGANIREAQGAESRADFIHKLKIAFKESEELDYWLALCKEANGLNEPSERMSLLLIEVRKLLSSIIGTSKRRLKNNHLHISKFTN